MSLVTQPRDTTRVDRLRTSLIHRPGALTHSVWVFDTQPVGRRSRPEESPRTLGDTFILSMASDRRVLFASVAGAFVTLGYERRQWDLRSSSTLDSRLG